MWNKLFANLRPKPVTISAFLLFPIVREIFLNFGASAVSARNIKSLLLQSNDGHHPINSDGYIANAVVLAIGGAREMASFQRSRYHLKIKDRKGFIRAAIETGASIVPVYSFGELDVLDKKELSGGIAFVWKMYQNLMKYIFNYAPDMYKGRFEYDFGLLARRCPITVVFGAPIDIERNVQPTQQYIDEMHERFCEELVELFETHKSNYIENYENFQLTFE